MKTYNNLHEYLKHFKVGDKIVLGGRGILDGLKHVTNKYDTYTVQSGTNASELLIKAYRGRTTLTTNIFNQQVGVLTDEQFKSLTVS